MPNNFAISLAIGQHGQNLVVDFFTAIGYTVEDHGDLCLPYDLIICKEKQRYSLEVKNDVYAAKSGNIAIEVFNSNLNKPSGINSTTADFWIQVLQNELWISSVNKLRDFVEKVPPLKIVTRAGDGNATLKLYKKELILPTVFHCLNNLSVEAVNWVLKIHTN